MRSQNLPTSAAAGPVGDDCFIACLLPVRNGRSYLRGYLQSLRWFADAVIALDDGSTDGTDRILQADPLVKIVLSLPSRQTYHGWNDAQNRNMLLKAAQRLMPTWVLFLDVDERLDGQDAAVLRQFLYTEAITGVAYGMRVFRMIDSIQTYDKDGLWVFRLFAFTPGQRVPARRLHFEPVATDIPTDRWCKTTVRIKHLAGLTAADRRARYRKYLEADPYNRYQGTYRNLLEPPGVVKHWPLRPKGIPIPVDLSQHARWVSGLRVSKQAASSPSPKRARIAAATEPSGRVTKFSMDNRG